MRVSSTYLALMVLSVFGERKKMDPKNVTPTVKHGGGHAMVWGFMGYAGVGELAIVEGIMNAKGYVNLLRGNLKKSVHKLGIQDSYLFQQDNDPNTQPV
jgi:hypothetical protein